MSINELLQEIQTLINAFKNRIFPTHRRTPPSTNNDEFDRALTSGTQSTFSPIKSTQRKAIKILPL